MSNKKYYWLKLKDDFFNQKEIKRLRRIAGGDTYTIIYLKMLLLSLKDEGKIYFDEVCDDFADELALEIDEDVENVKMTLSYLHSKGLLEIVNENEYFMSDIPTMIGSESDSARRVRKHREKKKALQSNGDSLQSNIEVTNGNTEIEIDKEIEKEAEIEMEASSISENAFAFYQNNFGVLSPFISEQLAMWIDDMNEELVIEAMKRTLKQQKKWRYCEGILKDWYSNNIRTLDDVQAEEKQHERNKVKHSYNQQPTTTVESNSISSEGMFDLDLGI